MEPLLLWISLLERIEDPGQPIGLDADAGVGDLGPEKSSLLRRESSAVESQVRIVIFPPRG